MKKGNVCLFDENLREVSVYFKTRGGVIAILIELRGGECNSLLKLKRRISIIFHIQSRFYLFHLGLL